MSEYKYWIVDDSLGMGIVRLLLNRPDKTNAFTEEVALELGGILSKLKTNEELRILILSSTSDKFFSAGADIEWFARISGEEAEQVSIKSHEIFGTLQELPVPVIAAIKGYCFTAGLELTLCCDMIYVAENARLGLLETSFGITPGAGGTQRLVRLVGPNRAKEMIFNARAVGAEEAVRIGLANAMYPLEGFDDKINRIARKMLMNDKGAIARCKNLVNLATFSSDEGFRGEEKSFNISFASGEPRDRLTIYMKEQERAKKRKERKKRKAEKKQNE
jgi:enoyl-CoA hydratase/carnithine racemase